MPYSSQEIFKLAGHFVQDHPKGVIEILGPTASGKTAFSIELAEFLNKNFDQKTEIISVDSRQIYQGCDISSAKITPQEMRGIPHHGLNLVSMEEEYNVYEFQKYAFSCIESIQERGGRAILCGGTMLWLDAVSENYQFSPQTKGKRTTFNKVFALPTKTETPKDIYEKSAQKGNPKWPFLKIGIEMDRKRLYERINQRAKDQFENGLLEETQKLLEIYDILGDDPSKKPIPYSVATSFGYQEIALYLRGFMTKAEALSKNQQRNRNYAKRQLTWWRGRNDVIWKG